MIAVVSVSQVCEMLELESLVDDNFWVEEEGFLVEETFFDVVGFLPVVCEMGLAVVLPDVCFTEVRFFVACVVCF